MSVSSMTPLHGYSWGSQAIPQVIEGLYGRLLAHPQAWYYWKGQTTESLVRERQLFAELACAIDAGESVSPDPELSSDVVRLRIGQVAWKHFVGVAAEVVCKSGISEPEQEQLFRTLTRSKESISIPERQPSPLAGFAGYHDGLTEREREVLQLVALGKNNPEIAAELCISVNTVTRHLTNIFSKTSTRNRVEAAVYAARHHLV